METDLVNEIADRLDVSAQEDTHAIYPDWEYTLDDDQHVWRTCWAGEPHQLTVVPPLNYEIWPGPIHGRTPPTVTLHRVLPDGSLETISHQENFAAIEEAFHQAEEIREELDYHIMLAKL